MRLTLRTMLAYLDDILGPEDAEDISKKISESDFASSLVHRARDCVRRVRLGTPPLEGKGLASDANTVAEYLDNTLEAERVPELEKVCLESDVHLAEVTSCHQILTLVLGEPADVEEINRDRVYGLISRSDKVIAEPPVGEAPKAPPVHRTPTPSDTPEYVTLKRQRPEVPDYLRESGRARRWPLVATILTVAAAVFLILWIFGPKDLRQQVASWVGRGSAPVDQPPTTVDKATLPADQGEEGSAVPATENEEPPISETRPDEAPPAPVEFETSETPPPKELSLPRVPDVEPSEDAPDAPTIPPPAPEESATEPPMADGVAPVQGDVPADNPNEQTDETAEPGEEPVVPKNPLRTGTAGPLDIAPGAGAEVGRYLTDTQVAVAFDRESDSWRRLAPAAVLAAGDRVLTLPSFRPAIALANGITINAAGPSLMTFEGVDENAIPVVAIEYGRLAMLTVGRAGNQVHLKFGNRDAIVTFGDAQSTLALEVVGLLTPGVDPEAGPPDLAVDLYATSGQIGWSEAGKEDVVKAPDHVSLTERTASTMAPGQLPEWTKREVTNSRDQIAATALEKELTPDRPLSLTLKELTTQDRRVEVRALAIRCGGHLGEFEAYVSALNDVDQRASWPAQIDSLKAAISRGPQTAALVRESLEKQRGNDAKALYRMLWGYTAEQLQNGEAAKLVDDLSSESLDVRVLSFWNLKTITGMSSYYRPEQTEAKRKAAVTTWREKLNDGKVAPRAAAPAAAPGKSARL